MGTNTAKVIMVSDPETQQIVKPHDIGWDDAASYCTKKFNEGKTVTTTTRTWVSFPWVLAVALENVLKNWSATEKSTTRIQVPDPKGITRECVWGAFEIAGLGLLQTSAEYNGQLRRPEVSITVQHMQMFKPRAKELVEAIDREVKSATWIRGMALQLQVDEAGDVEMMAAPTIVEVPAITEYDVVLPSHLKAEISAGVLFPLRFPEKCKAAGLSVRRGALFAGRPGTGKTMSARLATRVAVDSGWGVLYIPDSRALEQTLNIAAALAPCLVICEDIDRQLGKERDASTDRILNALDGLDRSKPVMLICTSNHAETLPPALLRAGRLDLILLFETPDESAARTLVLRYLGEYAPDWIEDTGCVGLLPASIREVAQRAILHALKDDSHEVSEDAVRACAQAVRAQQALLEQAENPKQRETPKLEVTLKNGNGGERTEIEKIADASRALEGATNNTPRLPAKQRSKALSEG